MGNVQNNYYTTIDVVRLLLHHDWWFLMSLSGSTLLRF